MITYILMGFWFLQMVKTAKLGANESSVFAVVIFLIPDKVDTVGSIFFQFLN